MKMQVLGVLFALAVGGAAASEGQEAGTLQPEFAITGDVQLAAAAVKGVPVCLAARRISGIRASEEAYSRTEAALKEAAVANGLAPSDGGSACVKLEISSTYYVYTQAWNARLIYVPEIAQAKLDGEKTDDATKVHQQVDVVRVAAGVLGVMRGWISPSFGSYMVTCGAAPALFGSGSAPTRLFVAGKERYERGEQEVNTKVRVLRDGDVVATFGVRNWIQGDKPPFEVDGLVASNWSRAFALVARQAAEGGAASSAQESQ